MEFWLGILVIGLCALIFGVSEIVRWLEETDDIGEGIDQYYRADTITRKPK